MGSAMSWREFIRKRRGTEESAGAGAGAAAGTAGSVSAATARAADGGKRARKRGSRPDLRGGRIPAQTGRAPVDGVIDEGGGAAAGLEIHLGIEPGDPGLEPLVLGGDGLPEFGGFLGDDLVEEGLGHAERAEGGLEFVVVALVFAEFERFDEVEVFHHRLVFVSGEPPLGLGNRLLERLAAVGHHLGLEGGVGLGEGVDETVRLEIAAEGEGPLVGPARRSAVWIHP